MKGKVFFVLLFLMMNSYLGSAQQSMSDYSYIQVPETFEFLKGKDQHQVNSLTKFLFNKYGFNAYFENELPNVRKCDGLYAVVEGQPGFIYTRITVIVKDCNGVELFRSQEGKSKFKEYKKAYHQAVRRAFESFEELGVQQKEINLDDSSSTVTTKNSEPVSEEITNTTSKEIVAAKGNMPTAKFSSYTYQGSSFLLRKTAAGYTLSQEVTGADELVLVGKLTMLKDGVQYTDSMGSVHEAFFDSDKNLSIKLPAGTKKYVLVKN